jgi:type I restriction enzyme S subunit
VSRWKNKKVGELFDVQLGKMLSKKSKQGELFPYLANFNVRWGSFDLSRMNAMNFSNREMAKYQLKKNDILMCEGGEIGRCAVWKEDDSQIFFQKALHRLRARNQHEINPYFFYAYMQHICSNNSLVKLVGETSIAHLTREKLIELKFPIPEKTHQDQIVKILATWDTAIEKTDALIEAKERQFGWLVKRIYKNLELTKENKTTLSCHLHATSHIHGDKNAIIASVGKKGIRNRSEVYSKSLSNDYSKNKLVYKDEIAFGLANDRIVYGVNLSQEIFSVSSAYKTFKILGCDSRFLKYLLDTNNSKLSLKYLITSARQGKSVDFDGFLKEKFVFPEISKQKHISNTINTAQQEITLLKNLARQYRTQKRGLMQKLLSGEWQLNPKEENHEKR